MEEYPKQLRVNSREAIVDGEIGLALLGVAAAVLTISGLLLLDLPMDGRGAVKLSALWAVFLIAWAVQNSRATVEFTVQGVVLDGARTFPWDVVESIRRVESTFLFHRCAQQSLRIRFTKAKRYSPSWITVIAPPETMDEVVASLIAVHPLQGLDIAEPPSSGERKRAFLVFAVFVLLLSLPLVAGEYFEHRSETAQAPQSGGQRTDARPDPNGSGIR